MTLSIAHTIANLPPEQRAAVLAGMSAAELDALATDWRFLARPDQLPPPGDWRIWLYMAGRGAGKTRAAAEYVIAQIRAGRRREVGGLGPTADSVRRVMVEGPSGVLACAPNDFRPDYEPSVRRIRFPNGGIVHLFSAEEPERLRGPNLDLAWCDEICTWPNAENVWSNLQLALRLPGPLGDRPRVMISTTPRPTPLIKRLLEDAQGPNPSVVVTRATTFANAANLSDDTLEFFRRSFSGHLARQELNGELVEDVEGALWTRAMIEAGRTKNAPELARIVVAVDPAGGGGRSNDESGIVVVGKQGRGLDAHGYVLADLSGRYSPDGWARRAVEAYHFHRADSIIAEGNFGAGMVEATIKNVDPRVPIKIVHASRGKRARAEPVVLLYEQRKVHHVGEFPGLEDQLTIWDPESAAGSPDRLDALVWALTDLMIERHPKGHRWIKFPIIR
jgi:phage terminase large subunit-like protein